MCIHEESNLNYKFRKLASYPLNDGCLCGPRQNLPAGRQVELLSVWT